MRNATYCDFDVENHIKKFEALPLKTQKYYLRSDLRMRYNRVRKSFSERLKKYKSDKTWIKEFGKEWGIT